MKIDLGCGTDKKAGFVGIDSIAFEGVDIVADLTKRWPIDDDIVEEANCVHVIEHFGARDRVHFVNELYRVLKKGGKATFVAPHAFSERAYGDMTHMWPPVTGFWCYYLSKDWRLGKDSMKSNAPHDDFTNNPEGYKCDFDATWGYTTHPGLHTRNQEFQQFAIQFYKEAIQDIIINLTKK